MSNDERVDLSTIFKDNFQVESIINSSIKVVRDEWVKVSDFTKSLFNSANVPLL